MTSQRADTVEHDASVLDPVAHSLHHSRSAEEFVLDFEAAIGAPIESVANRVIEPSTPKAIFLVGSLPLGMATRSSDIDLIVMIDDKAALLAVNAVNSDQHLDFSNESDALLAGMFVSMKRGVLIDLQVAIAPAVLAVHRRLRRRGPELSESEVRTLGRLSSGWLLWQSRDYLKGTDLDLHDPAFHVYCCTKKYVEALNQVRKAEKSLEIEDIALALYLGRSSVEMAYLAYFASEGLSYLGVKWLAQLGHARESAARIARSPLLKDGIGLLFPVFAATPAGVTAYLRAVREFHVAIRALVAQKRLFRIAFDTCPQIGPLKTARNR
jgi:hypothetical protein